MRSEKEMMDLIVNFAKDDDNIRLAAMEGSKLNKNAPVDKFQDFDVAYVAVDIEKYKSSDDWLDIFGKRIIMQKPEAMPLFPPDWLGKCKCFTYLMLFEDGNRIDLTLVPLNQFEFYLEERDSLFKVLLDKDAICPKINEPSDIDFHVKKPSEVFLDNCSNEFWWLSTYVAKGLYRNEFLYAAEHLDLMRKQLLRVISWKAGIETSFSASVGKSYKYLERFVSKETWESLMKLYKNDTPDSLLESLMLCCDLFRETECFVSGRLGYKCPEYSRNIMKYITSSR